MCHDSHLAMFSVSVSFHCTFYSSPFSGFKTLYNLCCFANTNRLDSFLMGGILLTPGIDILTLNLLNAVNLFLIFTKIEREMGMVPSTRDLVLS